MIEQSRLNNQTVNSKKPDNYQWSGRLELLQRRIHEEDYLHAAIQRLALVLSKELINITYASGMREGGRHEWQRKRRK